MARSWGISIFTTILILVSTIISYLYIEDIFQTYNGSGSSSLASMKHSETLEVAGTIIEDSSIDIKEVIRKNQPKVVQIERDDGELGSGFLYNDKGDIITNAHIVAGASTVLVRMPDTQTYYGTVIGVGEVIDVAVVRVVELEDFEPMSIAYDYEGEVGDGVIAMGSPRGYQNTVTTGIISAVNRDFSLPPYHFEKAYQISAPIAPGSSGGPILLATTGEVVGINSAAYQGEVIGFSLPIKNIWSLVTAWSDGEYPEEPISYYRMSLNEDEANYLVHYFYESISNYDYVTAYSLLGSDWQSRVTYNEFRSSYQTTSSVHLIDTETTIGEDTVNVTAEIKVTKVAENGDKIETTNKVNYQIGIENDRMKILGELE
ncbi:MAG: S1C family serine protease [Anaerobacillus sp.]|uniref:S1C family serine protease n=1 Tax=Anaerobacillus sp. TaxID=1872506 RepID=UPI0039190361